MSDIRPHPRSPLDMRSASMAGEGDPAAVHELTSSATVDDLIAAFLREPVEYSTLIRTSDR